MERDYLRRALNRALAKTKKPPAEPTSARIAVGFSGESKHPPCEYSAWGVANMAAQTSTSKKIFFMNILRETLSLPAVGILFTRKYLPRQRKQMESHRHLLRWNIHWISAP